MYQTTNSAQFENQFYEQLSSIATWDDRSYVAGHFSNIPGRFRSKLLKQYGGIKETESRAAANIWVRKLGALFGAPGLNYAADDDEIEETAENAARNVREKLEYCTNEETIIATLTKIAERHGIEIPIFNKISNLIQRMCAPKWWRKQLRKRFMKVEAAAIQTGFVHKRAGLYASDETVNRRQKQKRKNARLLESMEAVHSQTGEVCSLAELASSNTSNPAIRRAELMTRISGIERFANSIGFVSLFITLTTPSRMHARLSNSGEENPKYDKSFTPIKAQKYLCKKVWGLAQSKMKREGIDYFGVRIVEPHHDGTPHWHMLVFVNPQHQAQFNKILREYALRDSPNELGAQEHRFTVKHIDPNKGSAAGYVAKYISKNIDGFGVDDDYEANNTTNAAETAVRVEAWASQWHIRQFQFFGTPSITPYRELRRLKSLPEPFKSVLGEAFKAADEGDWQIYMQLDRDGLLIKPLWEERPSTTYVDEINKRVRGIIVNGELQLTTREGDWIIREKESSRNERLCPPWTCVNNSTVKEKQRLQLSTQGDISRLESCEIDKDHLQERTSGVTICAS